MQTVTVVGANSTYFTLAFLHYMGLFYFTWAFLLYMGLFTLHGPYYFTWAFLICRAEGEPDENWL